MGASPKVELPLKTRTRSDFCLAVYELTRGAISQSLVRVKPVVVLEPQWQLGDDGLCVGNGIDRDVVALECFNEGFGHCHLIDFERVLMEPKRFSMAVMTRS